MSASNRLIVAILVVAALAVGFWMLLLGPKREEADKLGGEVEAAEVTLSEAQAKLADGRSRQAKPSPPTTASWSSSARPCPTGEETSSLLVELSQVADATRSRASSSFQLSSSGEAPAEAAAPPDRRPTTGAGAKPGAVPAAATVPPTEAAASLLPLGAIDRPRRARRDALHPHLQRQLLPRSPTSSRGSTRWSTPASAKVAVDGRLITLDGFAPQRRPARNGFPLLTANFAVTTYLIPPPEGITAGATRRPNRHRRPPAPEGESTGGEAQ